jgi:hypothetical protein
VPNSNFPTYDNLDYTRDPKEVCSDDFGRVAIYQVRRALASRAWRQNVPASHILSSNIGILHVEFDPSRSVGSLPNPLLSPARFFRDRNTCTFRQWSFTGFPDRVNDQGGCGGFDFSTKYTVLQNGRLSAGASQTNEGACNWAMGHIEAPLTLYMDR